MTAHEADSLGRHIVKQLAAEHSGDWINVDLKDLSAMGIEGESYADWLSRHGFRQRHKRGSVVAIMLREMVNL